MCRSMVDIQSAAAEIGRGKQKKIKERNHRAKIYWSAVFHRATIINTRTVDGRREREWRNTTVRVRIFTSGFGVQEHNYRTPSVAARRPVTPSLPLRSAMPCNDHAQPAADKAPTSVTEYLVKLIVVR